MTTKSTVEQRLARLEDERAIENVIKGLAWAGDHNRRDEWLDSFTENAHLLFQSRSGETSPGPTGPPAFNFEGRGKERLAAFYDSVPRRAGVFNKHILADTVIALDGDEAKAETYIVLILDAGGVPQLNSTGRYFDTLRRCPDSKWRISERIGRIDTRIKV